MIITSEKKVDIQWEKIIQYVQDSLHVSSVPDMNAILFLIGIQEYGNIKAVFTKEEKQDLINIGLCSLLAEDGYYEKSGVNDKGWPVYKQLKKYDIPGVKYQEQYLQSKIVNYFSLEEE